MGFFGYIMDKEHKAPDFVDEAKSSGSIQYLTSHRYMFFFAKQLFSALEDNIYAKDTTISGDGSWARGIAVMQPFDTNNDTEMSKEELNELMKKMREKGILKGFPSCC